jgi:hypothetical protein
MERLNGASYNYLVEKYGVSRRAIERWVAEAKNLKPEVSK